MIGSVQNLLKTWCFYTGEWLWSWRHMLISVKSSREGDFKLFVESCKSCESCKDGFSSWTGITLEGLSEIES